MLASAGITVTAAPTVVAPASDGSGSSLASTGAEPLTGIAFAAILLLLGAAGIALRARRRHA